MSAKVKTYFFETPKSELYDRFSQKNIPTETTFRTLFDSVPFKLDVADTSTASQQGLVKLVSDANAESRTSAGSGAMAQVVQPHQLPMLIAQTNEVAMAATATYKGVVITGIEKGATGAKRLSYKVGLDFSSLDAVTTPASDDYVVGVINGVSCKILLSEIASSGSSSFWERDILDIGSPTQGVFTTLYPTNANDNVNIGSGILYSGGVVFGNGEPIAYIVPRNAVNNGVSISIVGGSSDHVGSKAGGHVSIYGGEGVNGGADGNVVINYDGSNMVGAVGINGAIDDTLVYRCKITNHLWVTGNIKLGNTVGGGTIPDPTDGPFMLTSAGVGYSPTKKRFMDYIVGATLASKAIIYFDGTNYGSVATGATADKYLVTGSGGTPTFGDLVLTGKVTNASFSGDGIITVARLETLATDMILKTDGSGKLASSGVASSKLTYIDGLTSSAQTQLDTVKAAAGGSGMLRTDANYDLLYTNMYSTIILECTANSVNVNLPLLADVPNNTILTFVKKFTGGAFAGTVTLAGSDKFNLLAGTESSSALTISGSSGDYVRIQKYNGSVWHQIP